MKRIFYSFCLIAALVLSSCGNKSSANEINGIASFETTDSENDVCITPYGKRYHHGWCRTIQGHSVSTISLEKAERRGRTPCHVCYKYQREFDIRK